MYAAGNPKSKKQLKEWIAEGRQVEAFQPGPFSGEKNGRAVIEGPHYPKPHSFYATVELSNGIITKVIS